jgi:hypothetical protein
MVLIVLLVAPLVLSMMRSLIVAPMVSAFCVVGLTGKCRFRSALAYVPCGGRDSPIPFRFGTCALRLFPSEALAICRPSTVSESTGIWLGCEIQILFLRLFFSFHA